VPFRCDDLQGGDERCGGGFLMPARFALAVHHCAKTGEVYGSWG